MARIEFRTTRSSRGRVRGARLFATAALAAITSVGTFASVAYGATVSHALTGHDSSTSCNSSKSGDLRAHDSGSATSCSLSASPTSPTTVNTPVTFTYQLNASEDGNAIGSSPVTYTIQGGATSVTGTATTTSTAYGLQATFSYTFGSAGSYTISATYQGTVDRLSVSNDSNGDQQSSSNSGNNGDDESGSDLTATINNYTVTNGSGTVTLYGDGGTYGSGSSSTYSCVLGSPTTPTVPSAPVGYSFAGWSVTPSNGGVDTTGPVNYTSSVTCATLSLFAVWSQNAAPNQTVTFYGNGATSGSMAPQIDNAPTALSTNGFSRSGYSFVGWDTSSAGSTVVYTNGQIYPFSASTSLFAVWSQNSGLVTLYGDGGTYGSGSSSTYFCVLGSPTTPTVPVAPVGYSFVGWSVTPSSGGVDTTGPVSYASSVTCATLTLYAVWSQNSGLVTLYGDGGTYGSGSSSTYACVLGSPTTPTVPSAPVGYSFAGWSVMPSSGGVDTTGPVSYASSVTCATLTLYAVWTPVSVTVEITNIPSNAAYLGSFTPAYATSGNGTVFSATSATPAVCVVNGTAVNFVGVGSCTLIASVGATPTSPAATGSPQSFVVSPLTPTVSITNMPSSPKKGSSFVPTFITSGNGTVFSVTSNSAGCSVSGSTVSFVEDGPCSLVATVAATTDYTQATSVQTTQTTNAVAAGTPHFPMIVSQSGIGGVRSNVASLNLTRPGTTRGRFAAGKVVDLIATPKPGFLVNWSGACSGATTHCVVTVRNAEHVHVAFRAAVTLPVFYFATNMTNITLSPAQVTQLKHDLVTLARLRVTYLTIKAFADYRNGTVYNQALSQRRANSVTAFIDSLFPQLGLTPMRMINLGEGILRASNVLQFDRKAIVLYI